MSGLNNVNVDFRPAVELIKSKPDKSNQPLPGANVVPENAPQPGKAEAKSVVRQLDVLLLGAASKSVSADVATNVTTIGQKLVNKDLLTEKEASKLESLATDAAAKLKALDKFSGRELATALRLQPIAVPVRTGCFSFSIRAWSFRRVRGTSAL